MNTQDKARIIDSAKTYMSEHSLSQNRLASMTNINPAYLSVMLSGSATIGDAETEISDSYYIALADTIGVSIKQEYWKLVRTIQFRQIITELELAKSDSLTRVLIGDTGCGKTYSIEKFKKANPAGTFVITCHRFQSLTDIVNKLAEMIKGRSEGTIAKKLDMISIELYKMYRRGESPIVIFDEAENLTIKAMQMLKALYDYLKDSCSIVLIGTDQLTTTMERLRRGNRAGIPQFYRRFKAGIIEIKQMDSTYAAFFAELGIKDQRLIKSLRERCDNYGELYDYLSPVIKESARQGIEPNVKTLEALFNL